MKKVLLNITNKFEDFYTSRTVFYLFTLLLITYNFIGLVLLTSPVGSDYWEHLATILKLSVNPLSINNPYIINSANFFLNTPYHLFWGLFSKILNVHPFWLLPLIGTVNIILLIFASLTLSKFLTNSKKYALIILLTLLFFWYEPWTWSGFYPFGMLPLTSIYPYWCAFPLSLIIISNIYKSLTLPKYILLVLLMAIVFLIHPLTASFLFLSIVIISISSKNISARFRILLFISPVVSLLITFIWPYFSVMTSIFEISGSRHFLGDYWMFYVTPWKSLLPSLLGFIYLFYLIKIKKTDFVVLGLIVVIMVFYINRFLLHNQYFSRYLIYITFFLHLSIVMMFHHVKNSNKKFILYIVYTFLLLSFGGKQFNDSLSHLSISSDNNKNSYSNIKKFKSYSELSGIVNTNDIILAPIYTSWMIPSIVDCSVYTTPHAEVFDNDDVYSSRKNDTINFFDDTISKKLKKDLVRFNSIDFVLLPKNNSKNIILNYDFLDIIMENTNFILYRVNL